MMKATVNGRIRELPDGLTVAALLDLLGSARSGVAVACNERVVRRREYDTRRLSDGDRIEIIEAVAGG
jgi:sulfur carrier protein